MFPDGKRMKITAVHYEGDSSSLVLGRHQEYQGTDEEGWAVISLLPMTNNWKTFRQQQSEAESQRVYPLATS